MHASWHCCTIVTSRGAAHWLLLVDTYLGALPGFRINAGRGLPAAEVYFEAGSMFALSRPDANLLAIHQAILLRLLGPTPPVSWSDIGTTMPHHEYTLPHLISNPPKPPSLMFLSLPSLVESLNLRTLLASAQAICNATRLPSAYVDYPNLSTSLHGRILATPEISWSLYVLLGVDHTQTSLSYLARGNQSIKYTDYYASNYDIQLHNVDLPLVAVIRLEDLGDHQLPVPESWDPSNNKVRFLPPELCLILPEEFDLARIQTLRLLPDVVKHVCDIQSTVHALTGKYPNCGRIGGERYFAITVGLRLDQGRGHGLAGWRTPFGPLNVSHTDIFQRLELLGDAVLGFIVTARLLCLFPNASIGTLVELKIELVCNETLNHLTKTLGLPQLAKVSNQLLASSKTWADMYEEVVGSIFTGPNGINGCEEFLARTLIGPEHASVATCTCPDLISKALEHICAGDAKADEVRDVVDYACEQNINVFCSSHLSAMFLERLKAVPTEELADWYHVGIQASHSSGTESPTSVVDVIVYLARGLWLGSPGFYVMNQSNDKLPTLPMVPVLYVYHRSIQHPAIYGSFTNDPKGPIASKVLSLFEKFLVYNPSSSNNEAAAKAITTSLAIPIPTGTIPFLVRLLQLALTPQVYQKLELLGDAFLKCSLALHLHTHHPTLTEGALTRMRQSAESNHVLGVLTKKLPSPVLEVIADAHPGIQPDSKVYGDTFESILAAVLLACGEEAASSFVRKLVLPRVTVDA